MRSFMIPLLVSPMIALLVLYSVYPFLRSIKNRLNLEQESCFCVENIAAILLASTALNAQLSNLLIGVFMVLGGLLNSEKEVSCHLLVFEALVFQFPYGGVR